MKKMASITLSVLATSILMLGCNSNVSNEEQSETHSYHQKDLTQHKMHKLIIHAGEEAGWIMTEYKSNTILAEKIDGDDSISAEVKFTGSTFSVISDSDADDLEDAIEDALEH